MDKGIYTALSGGIAKSHELDLIANNLANANTPGFKRETGTFNEYLTSARRPDAQAAPSLEGRVDGDKSFVEMDGIHTDFAQGGLQRTARPLDMAVEGKGFFEVLTPSGVRYTRQGNFSVSPDGKLVTVNGYPVLGAGENGTGPPEGRVLQLGPGPVEITLEGDLIQNGQKVGKLSVVEFNDLKTLEKVGNSYYRTTGPADGITESASSRVHQGFLEGSNVNPVREMTRLIEATRAYESHMQAIKTYQEIDGRTVNDLARERY